MHRYLTEIAELYTLFVFQLVHITAVVLICLTGMFFLLPGIILSTRHVPQSSYFTRELPTTTDAGTSHV